MKKAIFLIFTICSILSYFLSGLLLGIHFTQESPGMIMIYLFPFLIIGLVLGIVPFILKRTQKLELGQVWTWLHQFNMMLVFLGIIAILYVFNE